MRGLVLILAAACCAGCVKSVALGPIEPASAAERSSERAGVVCGERLLAHVERASAGIFATRYQLELGEPLCGALVKSVEHSYRAAQLAAAPPHKGQYGRVIRFELQSSALHLLPQANGSTRVVYTASVVVERYGRELQPLGRNAVRGHGLVECREPTEAVVRQVVEAALRQLADEASSLLVARLDGPRVPAARPR